LFEPIRKIKNGRNEYYPKTLKVLLNKIRNGLAHQHIEPVNKNRFFSGIIIRNYYDSGKINQDLEVEFDRRKLERFGNRSVGMLKTRQLSGFMFKLIVLTVLLTKITRNKVNIAC
jgi:hypothetical protein